MKYLLLPIGLAFLFSCSNQTTISLENQPLKVMTPPTTVKLDNNLFMDETEISNINYREYLYWVKSIFGKKSTNYLTALPDTTVWSRHGYSGEPYTATYFRHPAYNDYPVVGVSYEQAKNYAKWRSDRVFEQILIQQKNIAVIAQNADNYFTIERYFKGEFEGVKPDFKMPYPTYRLPTEAEWETAAKGLTNDEYGINDSKKAVKKADHQLTNLFNINSQSSVTTSQTRSFLKNDYGIYNMIGNVAEMVEEQGISKGGSFLHSAMDAKISNDLTYDAPQRWLGFRNVCTYQIWK